MLSLWRRLATAAPIRPLAGGLSYAPGAAPKRREKKWLSGVRIWHCCELCCRSQTQLGSWVAVAMARASSYSSDLTPRLGISICYRCGQNRLKKLFQGFPGGLLVKDLVLQLLWPAGPKKKKDFKLRNTFLYNLTENINFLRRNVSIKSNRNIEVPIMAQWKQIRLGAMRLWVWSLASVCGLRIWHCCELWYRLQTWLGSGVAVAVV